MENAQATSDRNAITLYCAGWTEVNELTTHITQKFPKINFAATDGDAERQLLFQGKSDAFAVILCSENTAFGGGDASARKDAATDYIKKCIKPAVYPYVEKTRAQKSMTDAQIAKFNEEITAQIEQFNRTSGEMVICDFDDDYARQNHREAFKTKIEESLLAARIKIRKAPDGTRVKIFYTEKFDCLPNNTFTTYIRDGKFTTFLGRIIDATNENLKNELGLCTQKGDTQIMRVVITYPDAIAKESAPSAAVRSFLNRSAGDFDFVLPSRVVGDNIFALAVAINKNVPASAAGERVVAATIFNEIGVGSPIGKNF